MFERNERTKDNGQVLLSTTKNIRSRDLFSHSPLFSDILMNTPGIFRKLDADKVGLKVPECNAAML